jgi:hypothetical protein
MHWYLKKHNFQGYVGFEVLTEVTMKKSIFCSVMLCSCCLLLADFALCLFFNLEARRSTVLRKDGGLLLDYIVFHPRR